jgi:topoisomerase IA-like protein
VLLGTEADSGLALTLHKGRYGHYVQRVEDTADTRAMRGTMPMGMEPHDITPEVARALSALPCTVGVHPDMDGYVPNALIVLTMRSDSAKR